MTLRQQIIQDRIDETAKLLAFSDSDMAFLRLAHSIVTGQSVHAFDEADLVDGGQDKQIDAVTIEQADGEATIYIIQAKNTGSFSSNTLIQMHNGLNWIFKKPKSDIQTLSNNKFRDKIAEYRATQAEVGPSNIKIVVAFVTNGETRVLSDEFKQEAKAIWDEFGNSTFESFKLLAWGSDELVEQINIAEKKNKKVNAEINIRYDVNTASLIRYHSEGLKGIVCSASGSEIARIVNDDPSGFVFDSNIRKYLGDRGAVNSDIRKTCTNTDDSHLFWFLNNGITIACDNFDPVTDPDNAHVKITNVQIVNGCQTATTLAQAAKDGRLQPDVFVLLRIYEATNNNLVDQIVLTTNNQNKISSRDLRSNDAVQVEMQQRFTKFGLFYERKVRELDRRPGIDPTRIAPNELVAQSYLAVVMKKPADARRRKYKIWDDLYDNIFSATAIEPYVIAFLLHRLTSQWLRNSGSTDSSDYVTRRLSNNGTFHIARMAAFLWRGGDDWSGRGGIFPEQIEALENTPATIHPFIEGGLNTFKTIIETDSRYSQDLDGVMKSNHFDTEVDKYLYQSRGNTAV